MNEELSRKIGLNTAVNSLKAPFPENHSEI